MTEPNILYSIERPLPPHFQAGLSDSEWEIIGWIRANSGNGRDWTGTIRYVNGADVYQLSNHVNAGHKKR